MAITTWKELVDKVTKSGLKLEEVEELGLKFRPGKDFAGLNWQYQLVIFQSREKITRQEIQTILKQYLAIPPESQEV